MGDCERAGWAKLIWRYQCGDPEAIRELAAQRGSLIVGLVLVLCAGIAREYDHEYIGDAPVFFLLPLFASLVIALLLYGSLRLFVLRNEIDPVAGRLVSFLSLFWLTAPLAWIYALPAERLLPPVAAAVVNLGLLAIVASWRVWLLGRACALLFDASLPRVLAAILLPGSILVWVGSIASTLSLVSIMGGISLAPETRLLVDVNWFVFYTAPVFCVASLVALLRTTTRPTPRLSLAEVQRPLPVSGLLATLVLACVLAVPGQIEMRRYVAVDDLIDSKDYQVAIRFLSTHNAEQFPPTHAIPPDPQRVGTGARGHMPEIIAALEKDDREWVRSLYLGYVGILMGKGNHPMREVELESYARELARLGQTDSFARSHADALAWQAENTRRRLDGRPADDPDRTHLAEVYAALGIDLQTGRRLATASR